MSQEIEVDTSQFDRFIAVHADVAKLVEAAIITKGKPSKYWFVWEDGAKGKNAGPKTVRGSGGRIFSRQAPKGYVFRYRSEFIKWLRQELKELGKLPKHTDLVKALNRVVHQALALIKSSVPVDTGALRDSLEVKEAK